ncbi:hypothetical protein H0O01_03065 [Candidatus Micrarchaeota archaeon]|nr:hypothetical protein [Candidatus Micrarchaeota archaeon]
MLITINLLPKGSAQTKVREPLVEKPRKRREIPDWLKVTLVRNSCDSINFWKVAEEAGMRTQFLEFAEMHCNREREERLAYGGRPNKRVKGIIAQAFEDMMGKASNVQILDWLEKGYICIYRYKWGRESVRKLAVIGLVNALGKDVRETTQDDFNDNGLGGLLTNYYRGSPYEALKDAGYLIHPWEMKTAPHIYENRDNRVAAIQWVVEKMGGDPKTITSDDFHENGLRGVMPYYETLWDMVSDAGYDVKPWEMEMTPTSFYAERENRIARVRWLVEKLGKEVTGITQDDFNANGLGRLLEGYYGNSPHKALVDSGYDVKPWEMARVPFGTYDEKKNRADAVKWLVETLGKRARDITVADFYNNGFSGLLKYYNDSPYSALLEAGLVSEADEEYMRSKQHTHKGKQGTEMPSPPSKGSEN